MFLEFQRFSLFESDCRLKPNPAIAVDFGANLHKMHVVIDTGLCCGHGVCAAFAPETFSIGADGLGQVDKEFVSDVEKSKVLAAVHLCPEYAITLFDDLGKPVDD